MFWLLTVGVICLALGFVMGATFRQYRPVSGVKAIRYRAGSNPPAPKRPRPPPSPNPPKAPTQTIRIITQ